MFKNTANQKIIVAVRDELSGALLSGDAANITAVISKDGAAAAATNDVNPTEIGTTGFYVFDLTQAETNGDLILLIASTTTANMIIEPVQIYTKQSDISGHVWHVAKTGNDSNTGHSFDAALLTLTAAITAAANGDKIMFWPGDYAESLDINAANKALTIEGIDKTKCRITHDLTTFGVKLGNGTSLKNLTVYLTHSPLDYEVIEFGYEQAVLGTNVSNIKIEDCILYGAMDGIFLSGCNNILIDKCYVSSKWDSINYNNSTGLIINKCQFYTDASYGYGIVANAITSNTYYTGSSIINDCICTLICTLTPTSVAGIRCSGKNIINRVVVNVSGGDAIEGSYGIIAYSETSAKPDIILKNAAVACTASGTYYDIANSGGNVHLENTHYDTTKTSGAITHGASGAIAAVKTAIEAAGSHLALIKTETDKITDQIIEPDEYIDTTTTPWQLVRHKKGDAATEYSRKDIKTSADVDVTSATQIPGKLTEPAT